MKNLIKLVFLLVVPLITNGQETASLSKLNNYSTYLGSFPVSLASDEKSIAKFAVSLNGLGFLQFGPTLNLEFGLPANLVLNTRIRFPSLGLLSYLIRDDDDGVDKIKGIAFGGGVLYFFGEKIHKPYVGIILEYETTESIYNSSLSDEWVDTEKTLVFMLNGGFRFRFSNGLFLNTGAFLGAASNNSDWVYSDPASGSPGVESTLIPFGMLEVTVGIEF